MPWIQNVALADIPKRHHIDAGENSMLIQIVDPAYEFPTPKYQFREVHQFEFLDAERDDKYPDEAKITDAQAQELVRLLQHAQEQADAAAAAERKSQVRTVDRSERIRTYNFPENRLSDHRVNYKANNLDAVLNGELEPVIQSLLDADKAAKLAGN